jgi:transposase
MDTLHLPVATRHRRRYSPAFKNKLIAACLQPGASTTAIAVANGINPNLVRKWIRLRQASIDNPPSVCNPAPALVPVRVVNPVTELTATTTAEPIRLELQRGEVRLSVTWPVSQMEACTRWLQEFCS